MPLVQPFFNRHGFRLTVFFLFPEKYLENRDRDLAAKTPNCINLLIVLLIPSEHEVGFFASSANFYSISLLNRRFFFSNTRFLSCLLQQANGRGYQRKLNLFASLQKLYTLTPHPSLLQYCFFRARTTRLELLIRYSYGSCILQSYGCVNVDVALDLFFFDKKMLP